MAIILVNNKAYQTKQYLRNQEAPKGVKHCGEEERNPMNGHGHLEVSGDTIYHGHWVVYNRSKIIKVISDEDFKVGRIDVL